MKVTELTVYKVKPRWIFLRVDTDKGLSGWGELISGTRTEAVASAVHEIGEYLIGKDPLRIEDNWQVLYRSFFRGGPIHMTVVSGIEMALWDIKGKCFGIPAYEFLGGKARDKIMVYSWVGGDRPSDLANAVLDRKNQGFKAVKMLATEEMHYIDSFTKIHKVIERVQSVRDGVGYEMDIGIDFHGRVHKAMAKVLAKELEQFHPMFIEEPVLPENNKALTELARHTSIPIATGERLCTRWGFKDILKDGAVDIIQPDVALTGGILEARKISAMAEAFDVAVAPHAPYGPVALAASFQLDACTPNVFIQEQSLGMHYNVSFDLLDFVKNKEVFSFEDGFVEIPSKPGLGLEIDKDLVREVDREGLHWTNPKWRNFDGTVTEW
jgi:galactonate dehydratase